MTGDSRPQILALIDALLISFTAGEGKGRHKPNAKSRDPVSVKPQVTAQVTKPGSQPSPCGNSLLG